MKTLYHPTYGECRVFIGVYGTPSVIMWMHVDDIFSHGPNKNKLFQAFECMLNTVVRLDLICKTCKTLTPGNG